MFTTNWGSWSHQAIYDALHGADQGRDGFREAGGTWGDLAGRLVAVTDAIGRANTTLGAVWKGTAQEGATNAIRPLSPWVEGAREAAGTVRFAGQQQADRLEGARDAVPPPTYSSWMDAGIEGFLDGTSLSTGALAASPGVVIGTAGDDVFRAIARQQEEAEAARRAMEVYQEGSKPQMAALPKFAGPGANGVEPAASGGGGPDAGGGSGGSGGGSGGAAVPGVGVVPGAGGGAGAVPGSPGAGVDPGVPGTGPAPDGGAGGPGTAGESGTASAPDVDATPLPPSSTTTAGAAPAPTLPGAPGAPGTGGAGIPAPGGGAPATGVPGGGTFLPPVGGVPGGGAGTGAGGRLPPGTTTGTTTGTGRAGVPGLPGAGGGGLGGLPVSRAPGAAVGTGEGAGGAGGSAGGRGGGAGGPGGLAGLGEGARAGAGGAAAVEGAAARAAGAAEGRAGGVPMIPPGGMVSGQGGDDRHRRPDYLTEDDPDAIAGVLPATAPPVIGE